MLGLDYSDVVKCIEYMDSRDDLEEDYENFVNFLKTGLQVVYLKDCSDFLVSRENLHNDPSYII